MDADANEHLRNNTADHPAADPTPAVPAVNYQMSPTAKGPPPYPPGQPQPYYPGAVQPPPTGYQYPPPSGAAYYPPYPPNAQAPYPGYPVAPPPQQPQQQQQQQVVVVNTGQPNVVYEVTPYVSYSGAKTLACITAWCFNWLFGLIAYILAVTAENRHPSNPEEARKLSRASIGVSIAGIVVSVLIIAIVVGVTVGRANSAYSSSSSSCSYVYGYYTC